MNKTIIGIMCAVGIMCVVGFGIVGTFVSHYNTLVRFENNIEKFDNASKNVRSAYTLKIKEMAQIPDMYLADLTKVINETMEGRYGKDGSKAVFQFIQEQNLPLDPKLYQSIQAEMVQGRAEFKISQDKKMDICTGYQNQLNYAFSGFVASMLGFPKKDIDTLCKIVLDSETNKVFETHEDSAIKLR